MLYTAIHRMLDIDVPSQVLEEECQLLADRIVMVRKHIRQDHGRVSEATYTAPHLVRK